MKPDKLFVNMLEDITKLIAHRWN